MIDHITLPDLLKALRMTPRELAHTLSIVIDKHDWEGRYPPTDVEQLRNAVLAQAETEELLCRLKS